MARRFLGNHSDDARHRQQPRPRKRAVPYELSTSEASKLSPSLSPASMAGEDDSRAEEETALPALAGTHGKQSSSTIAPQSDQLREVPVVGVAQQQAEERGRAADVCEAQERVRQASRVHVLLSPSVAVELSRRLSINKPRSGRRAQGLSSNKLGHQQGSSRERSSGEAVIYNDFDSYFAKQWDLWDDIWCSYTRQSAVTAGNNTNNRLEAPWKHLKEVVSTLHDRGRVHHSNHGVPDIDRARLPDAARKQAHLPTTAAFEEGAVKLRKTQVLDRNQKFRAVSDLATMICQTLSESGILVFKDGLPVLKIMDSLFGRHKLAELLASLRNARAMVQLPASPNSSDAAPDEDDQDAVPPSAESLQANSEQHRKDMAASDPEHAAGAELEEQTPVAAVQPETIELQAPVGAAQPEIVEQQEQGVGDGGTILTYMELSRHRRLSSETGQHQRRSSKTWLQKTWTARPTTRSRDRHGATAALRYQRPPARPRQKRTPGLGEKQIGADVPGAGIFSREALLLMTQWHKAVAVCERVDVAASWLSEIDYTCSVNFRPEYQKERDDQLVPRLRRIEHFSKQVWMLHCVQVGSREQCIRAHSGVLQMQANVLYFVGKTSLSDATIDIALCRVFKDRNAVTLFPVAFALSSAVGVDADARSFRLRTVGSNTGIQSDSYNCGVFVLLFAEEVVLGHRVGLVSKRELQYLRYRYLCISA
ncbi:hypothetical protein PybrP1_001415 [[Pythium] brassicae (nom. inval.)]|nr:hypothetical protein PybrP1_001415 [[Pythium] brassicae (nom. inval.)]